MRIGVLLVFVFNHIKVFMVKRFALYLYIYIPKPFCLIEIKQICGAFIGPRLLLALALCPAQVTTLTTHWMWRRPCFADWSLCPIFCTQFNETGTLSLGETVWFWFRPHHWGEVFSAVCGGNTRLLSSRGSSEPGVQPLFGHVVCRSHYVCQLEWDFSL